MKFWSRFWLFSLPKLPFSSSTMQCPICLCHLGRSGWAPAQWSRQQPDPQDLWVLGCRLCKDVKRPLVQGALYHMKQVAWGKWRGHRSRHHQVWRWRSLLQGCPPPPGPRWATSVGWFQWKWNQFETDRLRAFGLGSCPINVDVDKWSNSTTRRALDDLLYTRSQNGMLHGGEVQDHCLFQRSHQCYGVAPFPSSAVHPLRR